MDWNAIPSWVPTVASGIAGGIGLEAFRRWLTRGDRKQTTQVTSFAQLFQLYEQLQKQIASTQVQHQDEIKGVKDRNVTLEAEKKVLQSTIEAKDTELDKQRDDYETRLSTKRGEYSILTISFEQMKADNAKLQRQIDRLTNDRTTT